MKIYIHKPDEPAPFELTERVIYGSSRLGMNTKKADMLFPVSENVLSSYTGEKLYEMSNHLGNVLTVINDIKVPYESGGDILYYATITNTADYSPFGVTLDEAGGRTQYLSSGKRYRFAYQGSEQDDEIKGEGNSYTTEFRMLDPRLGRWLSIDPMAAKFPWQSPYASMDNNPISITDIFGLEGTDWIKRAGSNQWEWHDHIDSQEAAITEFGNGTGYAKSGYTYEAWHNGEFGVVTLGSNRMWSFKADNPFAANNGRSPYSQSDIDELQMFFRTNDLLSVMNERFIQNNYFSKNGWRGKNGTWYSNDLLQPNKGREIMYNNSKDLAISRYNNSFAKYGRYTLRGLGYLGTAYSIGEIWSSDNTMLSQKIGATGQVFMEGVAFRMMLSGNPYMTALGAIYLVALWSTSERPIIKPLDGFNSYMNGYYDNLNPNSYQPESRYYFSPRQINPRKFEIWSHPR